MAQCDECGCYDDNHAEILDYPAGMEDDDESSKSGQMSKRTMNPIGITTGMQTYRKIIRCQRDMSVYVSVALAIS